MDRCSRPSCGETGAIPRILGIVRDTREATIAALEEAAESDFVLTSGGVSVGAFDFVKDALDALGAETKFWRVSMKPGKPVVLSRLRDRVILGLPGNPVSSFVSFHLFAAPALRKAMGQEGGLYPPVVQVRLETPLKSIGDRRVYVRVHVSARDGELRAQTAHVTGIRIANVDDRRERIGRGGGRSDQGGGGGDGAGAVDWVLSVWSAVAAATALGGWRPRSVAYKSGGCGHRTPNSNFTGSL